jgi:predicted RNA methylase
MDAITLIEERRLALQATCDAAKTQRERNQLGQFATPSALASDVLDHARRLLPADAPVRFLDPGIGTGSFYTALLRAFPAESIAAATGFEIDPHYGQPARELWQGYPLDIRLSDFTTAAAPPERYNLIVCNPPYVRHHHMEAAEKIRLQTATAAACGVRIGGLAGLYCHFLGLSHAWLADDGLAVWLVPSEFMDVNYGGALKKYLLHHVELLRIHRFNPNDLQFADALVSSAVVWFRKRRPRSGRTVEFTYGGTHANPTHTRIVPASALHAEAKWTRFPVDDVRAANDGLRLADFFKIQRGLATGDNQFFIMTREQIAARNLPREFFQPILPSPRYVPMDVIEAEPDGTPKVERQLFMLDCRLPEVDIQSRYPALWAYLETGKPGVSERYLCRYRSPWYSQENRPPAPFVCTYMGRDLKRGRPIRFILNRSQATAANVYLMLYPKPALARALERDPEIAGKVWNYLNDIDLRSLLGEGRVYGGGLYKMEPKELANVPADAIASLLPDERFTPSVTVQASLWGADELLEKRYSGYR